MNLVRHALTLLAACTAVMLTGCGQKGPLTLPDKTAVVVTTPPATSRPAASAATPTDKTKEKNANSLPPQ